MTQDDNNRETVGRDSHQFIEHLATLESRSTYLEGRIAKGPLSERELMGSFLTSHDYLERELFEIAAEESEDLDELGFIIENYFIRFEPVHSTENTL